MNDITRFDALRLQYRMKWDAYHVISHRNTLIRNGGREPSDKQIAEEKQAAAGAESARAAVVAAISRLGG